MPARSLIFTPNHILSNILRDKSPSTSDDSPPNPLFDNVMPFPKPLEPSQPTQLVKKIKEEIKQTEKDSNTLIPNFDDQEDGLLEKLSQDSLNTKLTKLIPGLDNNTDTHRTKVLYIRPPMFWVHGNGHFS